MKTSAWTLTILVSLCLSSVASADEKAHVITGQVVELNEVGIFVQSGKERVEINSQTAKFIGKPKVGDTVMVQYTSGHHHFRFDPENIASKIEVKASGGSNR